MAVYTWPNRTLALLSEMPSAQLSSHSEEPKPKKGREQKTAIAATQRSESVTSIPAHRAWLDMRPSRKQGRLRTTETLGSNPSTLIMRDLAQQRTFSSSHALQTRTKSAGALCRAQRRMRSKDWLGMPESLIFRRWHPLTEIVRNAFLAYRGRAIRRL